MKLAKTYDEIRPLIHLCRTGRLFDVQEWIFQGKPINLPPPEPRKASKKSPLKLSIELGFHSLVQVLLEGGAPVEEPRYSPLQHALEKRRLDIIELLVAHGADIHTIETSEVFETWSNDIVEYFLKRGADVDTGNPLAYALCSKIRPALGLYMRYRERYVSFKNQINIALRYHCVEGNMKWISLLLWAGADPHEIGTYTPDDSLDPEEHDCALGFAAQYGHFDVFKLKSISLDLNHTSTYQILVNACRRGRTDILKMFFDKGLDPASLEDKGSSLIQALLMSMSWNYDDYTLLRDDKNIDRSLSREKMKILHILVRKGARWEPENEWDIKYTRQSLLRMSSDYIMEFIWIMSEYGACEYDAVKELMRTSSVRSLVARNSCRYRELIESLKT